MTLTISTCSKPRTESTETPRNLIAGEVTQIAYSTGDSRHPSSCGSSNLAGYEMTLYPSQGKIRRTSGRIARTLALPVGRFEQVIDQLNEESFSGLAEEYEDTEMPEGPWFAVEVEGSNIDKAVIVRNRQDILAKSDSMLSGLANLIMEQGTGSSSESLTLTTTCSPVEKDRPIHIGGGGADLSGVALLEYQLTSYGFAIAEAGLIGSLPTTHAEGITVMSYMGTSGGSICEGDSDKEPASGICADIARFHPLEIESDTDLGWLSQQAVQKKLAFGSITVAGKIKEFSEQDLTSSETVMTEVHLFRQPDENEKAQLNALLRQEAPDSAGFEFTDRGHAYEWKATASIPGKSIKILMEYPLIQY